MLIEEDPEFVDRPEVQDNLFKMALHSTGLVAILVKNSEPPLVAYLLNGGWLSHPRTPLGDIPMKMKLLALVACAMAAVSAQAADVRVAVAANFTAPSKDLAPLFEKATGDKLILSFGSTGAFYAQIKNGAPFDILLAADNKTPKKAVEEGYGVAGSTFTYAVGKLVLWSSDANLIKGSADVLKTDAVKHVAVANPKLAPYGLAAHQTMDKLGIKADVTPKIVEGDNIGKTFQFVKTANAQAGFIALSQCFKDGKMTSGSGWIIPQEYYDRIDQDAVLLNPGLKNTAARRFLEFLKTSPEAQKIREAYGYGSAQ